MMTFTHSACPIDIIANAIPFSYTQEKKNIYIYVSVDTCPFTYFCHVQGIFMTFSQNNFYTEDNDTSDNINDDVQW